ncbi:MAG: hypothetical protein WBW08_09655, partial [Methyloceanibacter sp.]
EQGRTARDATANASAGIHFLCLRTYMSREQRQGAFVMNKTAQRIQARARDLARFLDGVRLSLS